MGFSPVVKRSARLAWLADYFARSLVLAQTGKTGMPQVSIRRPLGKLDLGDELGLEPDTIFHLLAHQWALRGVSNILILTGVDV